LPWSRYGFLGRTIMKAFWQRVFTEPIDTSRDQVLTDWPQVDRFADDFLRLAVERTRGNAWSPATRQEPAHAAS